VEVYAGESGAVERLPAFNVSHRYNQHQTGVRCRQRDDTTERAEGLWDLVTGVVGGFGFAL